MTSEPLNNHDIDSFISELRQPEAPATLSQRHHLQTVGSTLVQAAKMLLFQDWLRSA